MNILLVEDMAGFAQPIKACLEALGHSVTWIIGAVSVSGSQVTGILPGENASPLADSYDGDASRHVAIDARRFQLALVDGGLIGPISCGWDIVPALVTGGAVVVAISGGGGNNPQLEKAGATVLLPKEFVVVAIRAGLLEPGQTVALPGRVNQRLQAFVAEMRSQVFHALARKERIDLGYPVLHELENGS